MFRRIAQLGALSAVVAVLAFVQNRVMVQTLGAGAEVDAYYLAQTLPMGIVTVFGTVSLALFVPLFAAGGPAKHGRGVLGLGAVVSFALVVSMVVQLPVSRALGFWVDTGPGWGWILAILSGAVLYGISFLARTVAVSAERADWFVWAQVGNALVFIALLVSGTVRDLTTLSYAFAASALVQAVLVVVPLARSGMVAPALALPEGVGDVVRAGLAASLVATLCMQGTVMVDRWFAGQLGTGVVTTYYVADRVVQMLLALVTTAVGLVVFPRMAHGDDRDSSAVAGKTLVGLVVFLAPIASVLWVYAPGVVRLLFGGGRFDASAVASTAAFLRVLGLALVPMGLVFVLPRRLQVVRAFSTHATIAGALLVTDWLLKLVLTTRYGIAGLAPATALAFAAAAGGYLVVLGRRGILTVERRGLRDIAVAIALACGHGVLVSVVPGAGDAFWAAPVALVALWLAAAVAGGRYERHALALVFRRAVRA